MRIPIAGYEGFYSITKAGDVWSEKRMRNGAYSPTAVKERLMKTSKSPGGYNQLILSKNGKTRCHSIHRLVAMAFIPNPLNLPEVNHKDGVKTNNNVKNLEWVSHIGNSHHARDNGLLATGNRHGKRKHLNKL